MTSERSRRAAASTKRITSAMASGRERNSPFPDAGPCNLRDRCDRSDRTDREECPEDANGSIVDLCKRLAMGHRKQAQYPSPPPGCSRYAGREPVLTATTAERFLRLLRGRGWRFLRPDQFLERPCVEEDLAGRNTSIFESDQFGRPRDANRLPAHKVVDAHRLITIRQDGANAVFLQQRKHLPSALDEGVATAQLRHRAGEMHIRMNTGGDGVGVLGLPRVEIGVDDIPGRSDDDGLGSGHSVSPLPSRDERLTGLVIAGAVD